MDKYKVTYKDANGRLHPVGTNLTIEQAAKLAEQVSLHRGNAQVTPV